MNLAGSMMAIIFYTWRPACIDAFLHRLQAQRQQIIALRDSINELQSRAEAP